MFWRVEGKENLSNFVWKLVRQIVKIMSSSEKLCLQWNDFKENITLSFKALRDDKDFTDVTLACEDGQHIEVH